MKLPRTPHQPITSKTVTSSGIKIWDGVTMWCECLCDGIRLQVLIHDNTTFFFTWFHKVVAYII